MHQLLSLTAACTLFAAPAAFANAQNHHCDLNGAEVAKTRAQCTKAGGKWAKGAPSISANPNGTPPAGPNAGVPAPAPTPSDPSRDPAINKSIPVNTPPTPNGNNTITPPPSERTPGN
jgi:hypothetical protein